MMGKFTIFLALLAGIPLWTAVTQAVLMRTGLKLMRSRQMTSLISSASLAIPFAGLLWHLYLGTLDEHDRFVGFVFTSAVYILMSYIYFHIFNMSETARRIRMILEIGQRSGLKASELKGHYNSIQMIENRIERLIALGQVEVHEGKLFTKSKTLYIAASAMEWWRRILGFPPSRVRDQGRQVP